MHTHTLVYLACMHTHTLVYLAGMHTHLGLPDMHACSHSLAHACTHAVTASYTHAHMHAVTASHMHAHMPHVHHVLALKWWGMRASPIHI